MVIFSGENGRSEVSLYGRSEVTPVVLAQCIKKLQVAFPRMERDFYNLLSERIVANDFSDARLQDAVENLIDNFRYKEINVSDVVGYDKRIKLYTYDDLSDVVASGRAKMQDFEMRELNGRKFWVKLAELHSGISKS